MPPIAGAFSRHDSRRRLYGVETSARADPRVVEVDPLVTQLVTSIRTDRSQRVV